MFSERERHSLRAAHIFPWRWNLFILWWCKEQYPLKCGGQTLTSSHTSGVALEFRLWNLARELLFLLPFCPHLVTVALSLLSRPSAYPCSPFFSKDAKKLGLDLHRRLDLDFLVFSVKTEEQQKKQNCQKDVYEAKMRLWAWFIESSQ